MEEETYRARYKDLKYRYDEAILNYNRLSLKYKKLEEKLHKTILEYVDMIDKQAELGIELEARIRELEGKYVNNTTAKTL